MFNTEFASFDDFVGYLGEIKVSIDDISIEIISHSGN
jgi:hypothetical protein